MFIIPRNPCLDRRQTQRLHRISIAVALLASLPGLGQAPAAESRPDGRPVLQVPLTDSRPAIDGKLDEPSWTNAARTGPLHVIQSGVTRVSPGTFSTEVCILRDANHLIIGLHCAGDLAVQAAVRQTCEPAGPASSPVPLAVPPGSFIQVAKPLPAEQPLPALTLECWVRPRRLDAWQTLIAQHNYPIACGYGLFIDNQGRLQLYLSDGRGYRPERVLYGPVLALDQWQHVVGTWDGKSLSLWINGRLVAQSAFEGPVQAGAAPLWLGACGHNGPAVNQLQGDLAMPVIYADALAAAAIQARYRDQGRTPATGDTVLACWPTVEKQGDRVADRSSHGRHGRVVGAATSSEFVDLLIDSNADRNSYYLIRISPAQGGNVVCAYNEHAPPWHDRTWQPQFEFAVAEGTDGWTAELALPLDIFCKNKTLAAEIGFNVRRFRIPGQEVHAWHGAFDQPDDWGILTGIPPRDRMPEPEYHTRGLKGVVDLGGIVGVGFQLDARLGVVGAHVIEGKVGFHPQIGPFGDRGGIHGRFNFGESEFVSHEGIDADRFGGTVVDHEPFGEERDAMVQFVVDLDFRQVAAGCDGGGGRRVTHHDVLAGRRPRQVASKPFGAFLPLQTLAHRQLLPTGELIGTGRLVQVLEPVGLEVILNVLAVQSADGIVGAIERDSRLGADRAQQVLAGCSVHQVGGGRVGSEPDDPAGETIVQDEFVTGRILGHRRLIGRGVDHPIHTRTPDNCGRHVGENGESGGKHEQ